jgi:hypothetical protein
MITLTLRQWPRQVEKEERENLPNIEEFQIREYKSIEF